MIIKKCEFIKSAADVKGFIDDGMPQISIAGKSNVGKSSFINFITNYSKMAKTSNTPGRTRLVNYFKLNDEFMFVDLPGYGYAKASKTEIEKWGYLMEDYFQMSKSLKHTFVLIDSRMLPGENDIKFITYLNFYCMPFTVILTKADKLTRNQLKINIGTITAALKIGEQNVIVTSSETKLGKEAVLSKVESILELAKLLPYEDDDDDDENCEQKY